MLELITVLKELLSVHKGVVIVLGISTYEFDETVADIIRVGKAKPGKS